MVEQIIRPTGLLDPIITLKPLKGQIDETIDLCRERAERNERVLVTTLTKKTAEDLAEYLQETGLNSRMEKLSGKPASSSRHVQIHLKWIRGAWKRNCMKP